MTILNASNPIVEENRTMTQAFRRQMLTLSDNLPIVGSGSPAGVVPAGVSQQYIDVDGAEGSVLYIKLKSSVGGDNKEGWASTAPVYSFNRLVGTGTQSVTSTLTAITWNSSSAAIGSDVTYAAANPTRLTVVSAGTYRVGGYVTVQSTAQRAQASVEIIVNGTPTGLQRSGSYIRNAGAAYDYWTMDVAGTPFNLTAAQYVELGVGRVAGASYGYSGSLTINCDRSKSEFWLERVA